MYMSKIIPENTKDKYKSFLNARQSAYISSSLKASARIESYVNTLTLHNKITGECFPVTYDYMNKSQDNYTWSNQVSTYLQNKAIAQGKKAVFTTLTLATEYHKYKKDKKNKKLHVPNPKYIPDLNGYAVLRYANRGLYNNFRIDRKKVKLDYIRIIEPHKDFTPHLHAVFFIDEDKIEQFKHHFNNILKTAGIGVQCDFTILENTSASVSYILKYVKKSVNNSNEAESRIMDGWKKDLKIRMFSHSNIDITREVFRGVSSNIDLKSEGVGYSMLENLKDRIELDTKYFHRNEIDPYKTKKQFNKKARYLVTLEKVKTQKTDFTIFQDIIIDFEKNNFHGDWSGMFKKLDKIGFDYMAFHNYIYDFDYLHELKWVSPLYDFKSFLMHYSVKELIELYDNYLYDCVDSFKTSYKTTSFKIYDREDNVYIYDLDSFILL